jgi:nucleotide-binding universal stress UspA family protein
MTKTKAAATDGRLVAVGSDFSAGAQRALARAAQIARANDCRLLVVNVVSEASLLPVAPLAGEWSAPLVPASTTEGQSALLAQARETERRIVAELGIPDVEAVVRAGKPYEVLPQVAESRGARLLVLGVRAPMAPFESFFLGSTTERALRMGSTPVLLARRDDAVPYGRILLPVDLGDMSMSVLRFIATNFPDAAYDLVHFLPPTTSKAVTTKERRDTFLASLSGLALGAGLSPARTRVRVFLAEPREGILAEVKTRKPDLIAMGTHARTGVARVLLGSVADYVLHAASGVDVLVVPPAKG